MGPVERLLEAWSRVRGWYPVTMGQQRLHCDPNHISFWSKVSRGTWEPQTFAALDGLLAADTVYCDIGAWIGPTVLHAAGRCARVYCLEPDRIAYMYLLQNLRLNHLDNVLPFNMALAAEDGLKRMASPRGKPGDSMTSLLLPGGGGSQEVLCLAWRTWLSLAGNPKLSCLKMDIEGGEFALLPTMADYLQHNRPALYLSLHPHLLPQSARFEAMASVAELLIHYGHCTDAAGQRRDLSWLLSEQAVQHAGSYLFLP